MWWNDNCECCENKELEGGCHGSFQSIISNFAWIEWGKTWIAVTWTLQAIHIVHRYCVDVMCDTITKWEGLQLSLRHPQTLYSHLIIIQGQQTPTHAQLLNESSDSHIYIKWFASSTEVLAPTEGNTHWRTEDHDTFNTSETCMTWNVAFALAFCFSFEPVSIALTTPIHELFATFLCGIIVPAKNSTWARTHVLRKSTIIHYCWNKVCGEEENKLACCWLFSPSHNLITNAFNLVLTIVTVPWCIHNICSKSAPICYDMSAYLPTCLSTHMQQHPNCRSKNTAYVSKLYVPELLCCVLLSQILLFNITAVKKTIKRRWL